MVAIRATPHMFQPSRYSRKNSAVTGTYLASLVVPEVNANIKSFVPGPNIALKSPCLTRSTYGR